MWTFCRTALVEQRFGVCYSLATLAKFGVEESFFIKHGQPPTLEQADAAGRELALRKNLDEAVAAGDAMTREDFLGRFTNSEIARIYRAAAVDDNVFAYVKKMELNPTIRRNSLETQSGLAALEQAGLLDEGRTALDIVR